MASFLQFEKPQYGLNIAWCKFHDIIIATVNKIAGIPFAERISKAVKIRAVFPVTV